MSHQHAKALLEALTKNIGSVEKAFGSIRYQPIRPASKEEEATPET